MPIWIDGGSRGNPGPSAIAAVRKDDTMAGWVVEAYAKPIGEATNNEAEYKALLLALYAFDSYDTIYTDSALLFNQVTGNWRVISDTLRPLYREVKAWGEPNLVQIPREQNKLADKLVNEVLNDSV